MTEPASPPGDFLRAQLVMVGRLSRWLVLGGIVGLIAGLSSAAFIATLNWTTDTRLDHPILLWFLPLGGLAIGLAYHYRGAGSEAGNNLILDEIHEPRDWVPRRMAALVYGGTAVTNLFGGSAGREGTAIQISGSLTDLFSRVARLNPADRRLMLITAVAGGFGSVFGVPLAGCVFALEVQSVGRVRYDAIVPALTASLVGDQVVRHLGVHHTAMPVIGPVALDAGLVGKVFLAGVAFGLTSAAFAEATHVLKRVLRATPLWPPLRPFAGGVVVIGLTYLVGTRDYLGLSIPLITDALAGGAGVVLFAFAWKFVFTVVTLSTGFQGGEVTPLLVIGATLGATLGQVLGVPIPLMAALGLIAVFGGAANVPLASTIMGVELFGGGALPLFAIACITSYVFSMHAGIYTSQRRDPSVGSTTSTADPATGTA